MMFGQTILLVLVLLTMVGCLSTGGQPDDGDIGKIGEPQGERPGDVYADLGLAYFQKGLYDVALQKLNQGLELDPHNARLRSVLGIVYERLGEYELARSNYRESLDIEPHNPYVLNAYGSFLCARGEYQASQDQFTAAVKNPLYRTPWVALTNAGVCSLRIPNETQAEALFRRALQTNPKFPQVLLSMAGLSLKKGNHLSSRAYLQRYLEVAKHTPKSLWVGIQTERILRDQDTVATYELLLRSMYPDSQEAGELLKTLDASKR